jgi:hypothetical protein
MRKVFLSFVLFALVHSCIAQEEERQKRNFKGGLIAGAVTSQISGDGLGGWDKFGLAAGAWVNVPFSDRASATMTMKYINKGSRTKRDTINFNTFGYYLNYIEVPLWFSYRVSRKSESRLLISGGPVVGFLMKQKIISNGYDYEVNPPFGRLDVGAELGISYWITPSLGVHIMGSTSVLPTRPNPSQTNRFSYYEKGNYNQTLQLLLSIAF